MKLKHVLIHSTAKICRVSLVPTDYEHFTAQNLHASLLSVNGKQTHISCNVLIVHSWVHL